MGGRVFRVGRGYVGREDLQGPTTEEVWREGLSVGGRGYV